MGERDRLLTASELATYLQVPKSRIYDCWKGWGIPTIKLGRELRFSKIHVDQWLAQQEESSGSRGEVLA